MLSSRIAQQPLLALSVDEVQKLRRRLRIVQSAMVAFEGDTVDLAEVS